MGRHWASQDDAVRYYVSEGFRVFNGQCSNCNWQTMMVCWPDRTHDLQCDNCKKFTMQPYEELKPIS